MRVRCRLSSGLLVVMVLAACGTETGSTDIPDPTSTSATMTVASTPSTNRPTAEH